MCHKHAMSCYKLLYTFDWFVINLMIFLGAKHKILINLMSNCRFVIVHFYYVKNGGLQSENSVGIGITTL